MNEIASPCAVDTFLEALPESDRTALQPLAEMLGLRYAFVTREAVASGGLEASLLSARHLVPVRQLPGGRWDIRIIPLALVLTVAPSKPRIRSVGSSPPAGFQAALGIAGSMSRLAASTAMCRMVWVFGRR